MRKLIISPLLSLAFLMLSNGFFLTFVSAKLHVENYSSTSIGFIQAAYYAGFLIAALKSEHLIQRIRHIRAFSFFASIVVACTLLSAFANHFVAWIIVRFIMGLSIAALYVVIESWLLLISNVKNRGVVLAIYMTALYVSQSLSQFMIDFVDIESLYPFIWGAIFASLSVLPVAFTHTTIPEINAPPASALIKYFLVSPLGTIGAILSGIILGSIYTFVPNYAQTYHIHISYIMSLTIAGGFLLQYPIGHMSDIFDRRKVLMGVGLGTLASAIAMIVFTGNPFWMLFFSFILGGFAFTIYPLSITSVIDRCDPSTITTVTGVMLFAYSIGAVLGPILTPIFIHAFGGEIGIFYFVGVVSVTLFIVGLITVFIRKPVPKDEQESFVALTAQTPVGSDLDPRSDEDGSDKIDNDSSDKDEKF